MRSWCKGSAARKMPRAKRAENSEMWQGPGANPPDFFVAQLHAKPIGYQYRLANSTYFEMVQDS